VTREPLLESLLSWTVSTPLMDLEDPYLRMRVQSLTQLRASPRTKALAVYAYVKRLPLSKSVKRRSRTAAEVLRAGTGDAPDKATLLVAMLRQLGMPARLHVVALRAPIVRGLGVAILRPARPIVEVWMDERWVATDTYIFDAPYLSAARQRLKAEQAEYGYGIHVEGAMAWDGFHSAYVSGRPPEHDPMVAKVLGHFHDPGAFLAAQSRFGGRLWRARLLQWNLLAPWLQRTIHAVRDNRGLPRDGGGAGPD